MKIYMPLFVLYKLQAHCKFSIKLQVIINELNLLLFKKKRILNLHADDKK